MPVTARRAAAVVRCALLATLVAGTTPAFTGNKNASDTIAALRSVAADSTLTGHVVYVDFWASWCIPCRQSFPWMDALSSRLHRSGLRVITVNLDKNPAAGRKFVKEMKAANLPVVYDSTGTLAKLYRLEVMPTSFVYGRDGKLRQTVQGFHSEEALSVENLIESLLKEKGSP